MDEEEDYIDLPEDTDEHMFI